MAIQDRNTLNAWAIRGWKPLAQQVRDWYESFWHKSDEIPVSKIGGLTELLNTLPTQTTINLLLEILLGIEVLYVADGIFTIPPGKILEKIFVLPTADIELQIGTAAFLDDVLTATPVLTTGEPITLERHTAGDIYLSGITANTRIKFYLRPSIL